MAAQPKQRMLIHSDQALPFTSMDWPIMGPPGASVKAFHRLNPAFDYIPTGRYVVSMSSRIPSAPNKPNARTRLLDAATKLVREKGFTATSVDDLCAAAGVTKGAFFHHFESKEALGVAAANNWAETTSALFADAPYHLPADPLDRVFAYLDFRRDLVSDEIAGFTCLVGTMVQEVHGTSPAIRNACKASIFGHSQSLVPDIAAAFAAHNVQDVEPIDLALHFQAVLQGGFILSKASGDPAHTRASVAHLKAYVAMLCGVPKPN